VKLPEDVLSPADVAARPMQSSSWSRNIATSRPGSRNSKRP